MKNGILAMILGMSMSICLVSAQWCFAENPVVQTNYTADPAPMVYNDTVFLYTGHDDDNADNFVMKDYLLYTSTDLVNWTDHGVVASTKNFSWGGSDGAWASQCIPRNGKFYFYCAMNGKGIGVLVGDSPYGPFTDPLGKPLITNGEIDPTVFIDDDGQAYLAFGNPDCRYVKLNQDMISYSGSVVTLPRPQSYQEGPWYYKKNNHYYLAWASTCCPEGIGYAMADAATGPYTFKGSIMDGNSGSSGNHPGIIDYKGKTYVFGFNYAINYSLTTVHHERRSVCCAEMTFNTDGTIPKLPWWGGGLPEKGTAQVGTLNPYIQTEAEDICFERGVRTEKCSEGGMDVDSINNGDFIKVKGVDFGSNGAVSFDARVASATSGGNIEIHTDTTTGTLIGTCAVTGTGGWQTWATKTCTVNGLTGVHDVYFKFTGGSGLLFNFNWWKFSSSTTPPPPPPPSSAKCPCDIYKDGGTPCVAAHSTVRALYSTYNGHLYQIRRKSDSKTLDIGVLSPGGFANAAAVDSFLKGTTGTVSIIYDQSEKKNDLTVSIWGSAPNGPLVETSANRIKDTICGFPVYPIATVAGEGYRRNITTGVATGQQSEGMYMVSSGKRMNSGCCFDYGNAESDANAGGKPTGAMEALYFGSSCWNAPCQGSGPWFLADLEWGLFQGGPGQGGQSTTNTPLPYKYVSGFLKGDVPTYTIRANDATLDVLKTMGSSTRPTGWVTNKLTGAIVLAIGGDSSPSAMGNFYEGAMVIGRPSDTTENAVQKNIAGVYSGASMISNRVNTKQSMSPFIARFNPLNGNAIISYTLQDVGHVSMNIFNQQGKRVASISKGIITAGQHEVVWNTKQIPSGIYFWKIALDGRDLAAGKVVVSK